MRKFRSYFPSTRLIGEKVSNLERAHEGLVDGHHAAGVVELAAVVRRGEEGDQLPLREKFVAVLDNLKTDDHLSLRLHG